MNTTRPAVIEFRGSDPEPNSLLVFGTPVPAPTLADLCAAECSACELCAGTGKVLFDADGDPIPGGILLPAGDGAFERRGLGCPDCLRLVDELVAAECGGSV